MPEHLGPGRGHARVFRLLLRFYPPAFRATYGEEMTRFFLARLARARLGGRTRVARLWARTFADVLRTALAERRARQAPRPEPGIPTKGDGMMTSFVHDVRYAFRRLRATPLFSLSAVAILAIGIGLNAAVFNVVDTVLFRPPPFEDPERVVHIYQHGDDGAPSSTSFPAFRDMAAMDHVFAGVAATSSSGATWEAADGPAGASVEYASASYLPVLGLRPSLGRWFDPAHDRVGEEMAAVVSHRTWRTRLGGDPAVVGRVVRLNNQPVTVIGVGPAGFNGDAGALVTDFWLSISSTPVGGPFRVANLERRQDHWYQVKARLAPGVTLERARAAMDGLARRLAEAYPALNEGRGITVFAYDEVRFHPDADAGLVAANLGLMAAAALVLLLACSSLANLLLVRGISRGPEMAVREALGAGRRRVVRLLLLEGLLLALAGGAAGLAVARWSIDLVPALPLPLPGGALDVGFGHRVVLFGLGLALATGLIFGLVPALRSARGGVAAALRNESRGQSAGRRVSLLRGGLVTAQVVLSLVLVVGAGLLTRSLANTERVDPGVDADRIAVLGTNLRQGGVTDDGMPVVTERLLERVRAIPGVTAAAVTSRLPVQGGSSTTQVVEGYTPPSGTGSVELPLAVVSRDYFDAMGIPVLAGRGFGPEDRPGSEVAVVVNRAAARAFWGDDGSGGAAIGRQIRPESDETAWRGVVGVVGDVKVSALQEPPRPMLFYSAEQTGLGAFDLVARTPGDPAALAGPLRDALRDVRPTLPVTRLTTLEAHFGDALAGPRAAAAFMGAFSLLGLLLASLGVYAVVAFTVEARTRELGIRAAMGASRTGLVAMVIRHSLALVALGVALGLGVAVLGARALESMLFGVTPGDVATFAGAAVLLLAAAGVAAFIPARRAARANPVEALRAQ
ncbi:MAG TPA: ADOP family duplicated permease [Longimicrobiales bacterium]|nr:ADOP family duplicated permease [Longimicrobiales bacterium]